MVRPERWDCPLPIMEESERIKNILLPRHGVATQRADSCYDAEMGDDYAVRELLGYAEPEPVDLSQVIDTRAVKLDLLNPKLLAQALPLSPSSVATTYNARKELAAIHTYQDDRLAVAIGECGVHNMEVTRDNAKLAKEFQEKFPNLLILLRVFVEKPRTPPKKGEPDPWKGFIYDPRKDGSNDINLGVIASRMLACRITDFGQPTVKEQLNPLTPQFTDGGITQENSGARNANDQTLMELLSGSSAVVGNKNALSGDVESAIQASSYVGRPHTFIGISHRGRMEIVQTTGNNYAHLVFRGGKNGRNFFPDDIERAKIIADAYGVTPSIDIDVSHDNSIVMEDGVPVKRAINQLVGVEIVSEQIAQGEDAIRSVEMETSIVGGKQLFKIGDDPSKLDKRSITDEVIGPEETAQALAQLDEATAKRRECKTVRAVRRD